MLLSPSNKNIVSISPKYFMYLSNINDCTIEFGNLGHAKKHFYKERKEVFERMSEKWAHNTTRKYDQDLYEDKLQQAYDKASQDANFDWLDRIDKTATSSSDSMASLLANLIKHEKENKASPISVEEFKQLPLHEGLTRLKANIKEMKNLDEKAYSVLRKKAIRQICQNDEFALNVMKNGQLGKNARFLNLMTDVLVNTFNPKLVDRKDANNNNLCWMPVNNFKLFAFLAFDPEMVMANQQYKIQLQNLLVEELFSEPGHLSAIKGKWKY